MIVSRKLKLSGTEEHLDALEITVSKFAELFNFLTTIAWGMKSTSKFKLHRKAYIQARKMFPELPAQYVITALGKASAAVNSAKTKQRQRKLENSIRKKQGKKLLKDVSCPVMKTASVAVLDMRLITMKETSAKITTSEGRFTYDLELYPYVAQHWQYRHTGCEVMKIEKQWYLSICFDIPEKLQEGGDILGIDRGINNIAVCSNNVFYNSKKLRKIKGNYQHKKSELQSKGAKSAKRKLKTLSRKENRFVRDVNHCLSKELVNSGFGIIALEKLNIKTAKKLGKPFNHKLGNWSWNMLEQFLVYKALIAGVQVKYVSPKYTSQQCSCCGHVHKSNRNGSIFKCKSCGFQLHADLNAARNIAQIALDGKSIQSRLLSISPTTSSLKKELVNAPTLHS